MAGVIFCDLTGHWQCWLSHCVQTSAATARLLQPSVWSPQGPITKLFLNKPSAFLKSLVGTAVNAVTFSTSFNLAG